jgi:hypothetical protein
MEERRMGGEQGSKAVQIKGQSIFTAHWQEPGESTSTGKVAENELGLWGLVRDHLFIRTFGFYWQQIFSVQTSV